MDVSDEAGGGGGVDAPLAVGHAHLHSGGQEPHPSGISAAPWDQSADAAEHELAAEAASAAAAAIPCGEEGGTHHDDAQNHHHDDHNDDYSHHRHDHLQRHVDAPVLVDAAVPLVSEEVAALPDHHHHPQQHQQHHQQHHHQHHQQQQHQHHIHHHHVGDGQDIDHDAAARAAAAIAAAQAAASIKDESNVVGVGVERENDGDDTARLGGNDDGRGAGGEVMAVEAAATALAPHRGHHHHHCGVVDVDDTLNHPGADVASAAPPTVPADPIDRGSRARAHVRAQVETQAKADARGQVQADAQAQTDAQAQANAQAQAQAQVGTGLSDIDMEEDIEPMNRHGGNPGAAEVIAETMDDGMGGIGDDNNNSGPIGVTMGSMGIPRIPGAGIGCKTRKNFEYRFRELKRFELKHGHLNVPHKYPSNPQLGTWVDTQRRQYRSSKRNPSKPGALSADNVGRLLDMGFNFEPRLSREETLQ